MTTTDDSEYEKYLDADYSGSWRGISRRMEAMLTPRIGHRAAVMFVKRWRKNWWGLGFMVAGAVPAAIGGVTSISAVWILGIVLWCGVIIVGIVALSESRRLRALASKAIGIELRWGEPPLHKDRYLSWCKKRGVRRFAAKDPPTAQKQ